jgi:hypothetical protein
MANIKFVKNGDTLFRQLAISSTTLEEGNVTNLTRPDFRKKKIVSIDEMSS